MGHGNPLCFVYVLTCENFSLRLLTKQITRQGPTPVGPVTFSSSSFRPSEELTKLTMAYATTQGIVLCVLLFGELAAAAEKGGCCPSTVHTVASPGSPRPRRPRVFFAARGDLHLHAELDVGRPREAGQQAERSVNGLIWVVE